MQVDGSGSEEELDIFQSFASTLAALQAGEFDILEAAEQWSAAAAAAAASTSSDNINSSSPLESQVWSLISTLYASRLRTLEPLPSASELRYLTPAALVSAQLNARHSLADLAVLKDWLCATAPQPLPADIRRGYAPYSKHNHAALTRQGQKAPSLDPDAALRSGGSSSAAATAAQVVAPEDEAYEQSLLRSLFDLVRVGDLYKAVDLCRQADMDWRAASLNGAAVWSHAKLDGLEPQTGRSDASGNLNRKLWKGTASKLAKTPSSSVKAYERALYGALAGDLHSVLPVCESWEDHLWAHINALFEDRIDHFLALPSTPNSYFAHEADFTANNTNSSSSKSEPKDLARVFDSLLQRSGRVGEEARHPFRIVVACIAQEQLAKLFQEFVWQMEKTAADLEPENQADLIRFFAHLILFFRGLGQGNQQYNLPLEPCTKIIDAYVQILQLNEKPELVALYASQLQADNAIEAYAQFLASISSASDHEQRRAALLRTREHDLDCAAVAIRTTQLIIESSLSPPELDRNQLFSPDVPQSDAVEALVRSVEWISFDRATYVEALLQTNALVRWFMICGLTAAAQRLLLSLPSDLEPAIAGILETEEIQETDVLPSRLISALAELQNFKDFFGSLEAYDACRRWVPPASASRLEQAPAVDELKVLTQQFYDAALSIFTGEWLELEVPEEMSEEQSEQSRLLELATLRKVYVPELVLRLHHVLVESRSFIPQNLQKAIELSHVVADEVSHVYREFASEDGGNRMGEYLSNLRAACIMALGTSSNPFVASS